MLNTKRDWWSHLDLYGQPSLWLEFVSIDPGGVTGFNAGQVWVSDLRQYGSDTFGDHLEGSSSEVFLKGVQFETSVSGEGSVPSGSSVGPSYLMNEARAVMLMVEMIEDTFGLMARRTGGRPTRRVVVIEDFVLRERSQSRSLLSPVRLTSMFIDRLNESNYNLDICIQSPNDKSIITDRMLKAHGLFVPGKQHANDAARHSLLFTRKVKV